MCLWLTIVHTMHSSLTYSFVSHLSLLTVIGVDLAVARDGFPLQRKSVAILIAEKLSNGTQRLNDVHPFIVDITLLIVLLLFNIMHYSNLFQYFLSMCYGPCSS